MSLDLHVVLVIGLSGAGNSTVLSALEDCLFFSVQGIPVEVISKTVILLKEHIPKYYRGIVIGIHPLNQGGALSKQLTLLKEELSANSIRTTLFFIEASVDSIIKRYSQTRRPHPLEGKTLNLEQAIKKESSLHEIKKQADLVIDTTKHTPHTLRKYVKDYCASMDVVYGEDLFRLQLITFGFKYGIPQDADILFDLRFLPNPYFVEALKDKTGFDKDVQEFVFAHKEAEITYNAIIQYCASVIPLYKKAGWHRLSLAIGCTGGKHRSVSFVERLTSSLETTYSVHIEHRNVNE